MKKFQIAVLLLAMLLPAKVALAQTSVYPFSVKISGHGKAAMVLIPGFGCSGEVWNETLALYERRYTCYTLTMAGFAGTPAQPGASFTNWEAGIAAYLTDHHIRKPVIIGHSMGAALALALAADHPELPSRIVIVDVLPCLAALNNPAFKANPSLDCSPLVKQFTGVSDGVFKAMQERGMRQLLADTSRLAMVTGWTVRSDRATFAAMYCDFMNTDLRGKLGGIRCPALVMLEAGFTSLKPAIAEQYRGLHNAQLVYATKGLHFIMYDDPQWYAAQLAAFIP